MIVYTCITDNYDTPIPINCPYRAIMFSDKDIKCEGWEVIKLPKQYLLHRMVKAMPNFYLPQHEKSLWIDANLEYRGDWKFFDRGGTWCMKHNLRSNIGQERWACFERGKDTLVKLQNAVDKYGENCPLVATGMIVRENNHTTKKFNAMWADEIINVTHRDQMSFTWCAEQAGMSFSLIPFLPHTIKHKHAVASHKPAN